MSEASFSSGPSPGPSSGLSSRLSSNLGRVVFGVAALGFGVITLVWKEYNGWHLARYIAYAAAAALIFGGGAIQFRRTAKAGAAVLGAVYLACALACVPRIVAAPRIYNNWGNFFEQFSLVTGATMVYARWSSLWSSLWSGAGSGGWSREMLYRMGRILLGICSASFCLEQAFYLHATATFVPKWLPPGPMFWAVTTTVLFALAAVALVTNRMALLASRLLTLMLVLFGLLVWIPALLSDAHSPTNWSETSETFAIAGTAWILADYLGERGVDEQRAR
jgi:putative oxidoreductase